MVLDHLMSKDFVDDSARAMLESRLLNLTSYIPVRSGSLRQGQMFYPNERLSKVLIDNYTSLVTFASSYFNLSLASHITRYLVDLIYALEYWELYHLLYFIPNLDYFFKLIGIDVITTPFGPLVRPPETYCSDTMSQGFEYPFPYPFYNYSFHSFDPSASQKKQSAIHITPYVDITLTHDEERNCQARGRAKLDMARGEQIRKQIDRGSKEKHNTAESTESSEDNQEDDDDDDDDDDDEDEDEDDDDDSMDAGDDYRGPYNGEHGFSDHVNYDQALNRIMVKNEAGQQSFAIIPIDGRNFGGDKKTKNKSGVIHQCHLIDPQSNQTCLKIFYGKNELLRHQEFVHATKKKIYKCIYCSQNNNKVQSYPRHDSLARHIRRKHGITGRDNKMAVNYAKANVEIIDESLPRVDMTEPIPTEETSPSKEVVVAFTEQPSWKFVPDVPAPDTTATSPFSKFLARGK